LQTKSRLKSRLNKRVRNRALKCRKTYKSQEELSMLHPSQSNYLCRASSQDGSSKPGSVRHRPFSILKPKIRTLAVGSFFSIEFGEMIV
jgi:hypothetical protein